MQDQLERAEKFAREDEEYVLTLGNAMMEQEGCAKEMENNLKSNLANVESRIKEAEARVEAYKIQLASIQEETHFREDIVTKIEKRLQTANRQAETDARNMCRLKEERCGDVAVISQLWGKLEGAEERIQDLEMSAQTKDNRIKELKNGLEKLNAKYIEQQNDVEKLIERAVYPNTDQQTAIWETRTEERQKIKSLADEITYLKKQT
ncbi:hypothetical protein GQ43DRAFT_466385 [Delitschia confertaspora ATCC 74209]|uniref:Uncharacterized protein n=1 Tax=Delitschia confertaspora ATCC 74209 TaxID=1513339 RepID=A0A9P4JFR3_9PLEO|nr:hypothetical protein GQ43DRAFT_466385 [Delitschia confertaspora ATCC 74209]